MRAWSQLVLVAAVTLLLSGCANVTRIVIPQQSRPAEVPTPTTVPITSELSIVGSTTVQPLVEQIGVAYRQRYPGVKLSIGAGGSVVGIQAVQNGDVDIGMSSRELREGELLPGMQRHEIAMDVLAVIVHPSNPVDSISLQQLQAIYTGTITNWRELGGPDMPILPVVREVTSGTRGAFDDIALEGTGPNEAIVDVQITDGEVEARVASTEHAIGYVGFGHIYPDEIKVLAIDHVLPAQETALDGSYKLRRPLLLLTGSLSRRMAQSFVDFALSPAGQQIVEEQGWVPVNAPGAEES